MNTQAYGALDAGRAALPGASQLLRLSGAALGIRVQHRLPQGGSLSWDVFAGQPLTSPAGFIASRRTAGFNLRAEF
jgi:hemolysin activation/secretion protein